MFVLEEDSSWSVSSVLPQETKQLVGASLGGVFYVLGGNIAGEYLSKVLSWNHDDRKWVAEGDMLEVRGKHAIAVVTFSDVSEYCL